MKIRADKIESAPLHALTVRDVRTILAAVPPIWIEGLTEARLANSQEYYSPWAFFSRYDGGLTIYSRSGTKEQALIAVLSALAASSLGIKTGIRRRPSEADRHRLEQFIKPFVERLLPELTPLKKQGPGVFVPMVFLPFPNDDSAVDPTK